MHTYILSWEEYLETHEHILPGPSIASFVAMLFIAFAVGVFGIALTYAVDPGSKLTASVFCWLSVAVFFAAFWDLRVRSAKRRLRSVQDLRAVYKTYYSGERAFGFDNEKWTLQTESGRQEARWAGILTAADWQNVITLSGRDQLVTIVPKRVLAADELQHLRRIAIGSGEKKWPCRVSLSDYLLTEVPSLWRRHLLLMVEAHAGGLFFFAMVANTMYHSEGPGTPVAWALAWLFLFLTITAQFWYFLIKYLTSHKELGLPWEAGFSQNGMHYKTAKVDFFHSWAGFKKFREAERCFLLYINSSEYYTIPKSCIPAEEQPLVRELFRARLTEK